MSYRYIGGGYWRDDAVPKGKPAPTIHGEEAERHFRCGGAPKPTLLELLKQAQGLERESPHDADLCEGCPQCDVFNLIDEAVALLEDE